jgi:hypothetical protein
MDDQNPEALAKATLAFQTQYDLDIVKVSPSSSFCLTDWGVKSEWRGNPEGTRDYTKRVIYKPEDWLDQETPPSLNKAQQIFSGAVCGGLRQIETLVLGTPELIRTEAMRALEITQGKRFILGTGCVVPTIVPYGNLKAACNSVIRA